MNPGGVRLLERTTRSVRLTLPTRLPPVQIELTWRRRDDSKVLRHFCRSFPALAPSASEPAPAAPRKGG